jgi:gas vesicle protein
MADRFDRFDNEGRGGGNFVMGLLAGTVLGAGLGLMFAPKRGAELRSQLSKEVGNLANTASEGYRQATDKASEWAEKGLDAAGELTETAKDAYSKSREAVKSGADGAQRYVHDTASSVTGTPPPAAAGSGDSSGLTGSSRADYSSGPSYAAGSKSTRASGSDSTSDSGTASSSSSGSPTGGSPSGGSHSGSIGGSRRG